MTTKLSFAQEHSAPSELRLALEEIGSTVEKPKKSVLFRRGDKAVGVFLVRRGKVSLSLDGTSVVSRTLGPGSLLGLPATLSGRAYSLTATAAEDCQLDFIRREAVLRVLREDTFVCFQAMQEHQQRMAAQRQVIPRRGNLTN
jgi:CRP-like cAMP-binding protein